MIRCSRSALRRGVHVFDRLVHLGGVVPGNDAGADRGVDFRKGRSPAQPEGDFRWTSRRRPPVQPTDDELELERDMEYFVEPEEALGPRTGDLGD